MSQLKNLASQTAIYGASSILGRIINYLLVGLHTGLFFPGQMGVVTGLYAYSAILIIIYTFGMETAFFRYAKNNLEPTYQATATLVVFISTLLSVFLYFNAAPLASLAGYPEAATYVKWLVIILWIDAILSIPFARLRHENNAKKFASVKILAILLNVGLQLIFLLLLPHFNSGFTPSIGYIFLANLIANACMIVFLIPELMKVRITIHFKALKPLLLYSSPLFLMGLVGMFNEQLDKIFLEQLLSASFYKDMNSTEALGVYGQTFKLGVFMMLAIQAFRYAGEPFFFSQSGKKDAPELFAKIMHYFIISGLLLFILVSLNVDLLAYIFLRNPAYRVALYLVPLMLVAKLCYGIYLNLSIWFKLTDNTRYGLYFSMAGLVITVLGNLLLIPHYGMLGCVLAMIGCYLTMCLCCYYYGRKHFPIPYQFHKVAPHFAISVLLVCAGIVYNHSNFFIDSTINLVASLVIVASLWKFEKRHLLPKSN